MNMNKKILLGLGCILALFVLYKYFNVVEGYEDSYLQFLRSQLKQSKGSLDELNKALDDNSTEGELAKSKLKNIDKLEETIKFIKITHNDLTKVANIMFPGTIFSTIEGMSNAQKRKKKRDAEAAAAKVKADEAAAAKVEADAAAAKVKAAEAEKTTAINIALKTAITSSNELLTRLNIVINENPIVSQRLSDFTPTDRIIFSLLYSARSLIDAIDSLKRRQGM
jgi:hypothetical protein